MHNAIVAVDGLEHAYALNGKRSTVRQALCGVTFHVDEGEIFGILGPNGGGKTTLFRILSTCLVPSGGTARIADRDVRESPHQVRQCIGVVFQSPSLDRKLTVSENLRHQGHLYGIIGATLRDRIAEILTRVNLQDRSHELVENLSGGLQRRVEIAKGLLHNPRVLLLDEPSTGLDPGARNDVWSYLKELKEQQGVTSLVTTHLMEEAEKCDRLVILHRGEIVAMGTPEELTSEIGGDVVVITSSAPASLADEIGRRFGGKPVVVENTVRLERERGHEFIPQLVEAFTGQISAVTLGKPTLEDVFIHKTGHRFWSDDQQERSTGSH